MRCLWSILSLALLLMGCRHGAQPAASAPLRIGDVAAYTGGTIFAGPYRQGWQLALEEINAAGGVKGRRLEIISRDTGGDSGRAVKTAEELRARDGVCALLSGEYSSVSLALTSWARQNKCVMLFAAANSDRLAWEDWHPYAFHVCEGTYSWASALVGRLAPAAPASMASIANNIEYGHACVVNFERCLGKAGAHAHWTTQRWPAYGKMDAGAEINVLARANPQLIYNCLYGSDLAQFVREARLRGLLTGRRFVSQTLGMPEHFDMLGAEVPAGWDVIGLPWEEIDMPQFRAFTAALRKKFPGAVPSYWSIHGYHALRLLAAALEQAASLESADVVAALESVQIQSVFGTPLSFRKIDHQATGGFWVGKTAVRNGMPRLVDWTFERVADHLPSDAQIVEWRQNK